ncbi:MAG: hypothetical protein PHD58_08570 [Anaerolineales bacterium]|nr:hypothetical protein [Anaerolineales bacterium]
MIRPTIEERRPLPVRDFLLSAVLLAGTGWVGLLFVILFTLPTVGPRWLFFFFAVLALTGTALPVVAFLNLRFTTRPPATRGVVVRQAIWVGIYGPTLAWLQIGRVLTPAMAILLAVGLVLIELLLRLRERSQWRPLSPSPETPSSEPHAGHE